jgi:hypothetical protein
MLAIPIPGPVLPLPPNPNPPPPPPLPLPLPPNPLLPLPRLPNLPRWWVGIESEGRYVMNGEYRVYDRFGGSGLRVRADMMNGEW